MPATKSSCSPWVPVAAALLACAAVPAQAALLEFNDLLSGETSYAFDGDADGIDDVVFSTTDPLGFNTVGPGLAQSYVNEPGLEGTSELDPDLRVDFLTGATGSINFGFALNSSVSDPAYVASLSLYRADGSLIVTTSVQGDFTDVGGSSSSFPEGLLNVSFAGVAAYGTFDFTSEFGRYIIDNFGGTFGSSEPPVIPEPSTWLLFAAGLAGLAAARRRRG